jgi:hypothetical protein
MDPMKNSPHLHSTFDATIDFELEDFNKIFYRSSRSRRNTIFERQGIHMFEKTKPKLFKFGIETILELKVKFDYSSLNEEVDFASRLFHFSPWQVLFRQVKHNALDDESDKGNSSDDEPTSTNRLTLTSKLPSLPFSPNYGM